MDSATEAPYKLIEFGQGDWNDWHFEQQQLMIVVHVVPALTLLNNRTS